MFDPHRIGPSSSSYYDRNKGRVLQRKLADPISEPLTRKKLLSYLPIMRLNGIVPTPIVRHFVSNDPTFSFDEDTYLAANSTVTFQASNQVAIKSLYVDPDSGPGTEYSLSQLQYKHNNEPVILSGDGSSAAYAVMVYISYNFANSVYAFHVESESETGDLIQFTVPNNSLYISFRHASFPLTFQLFTTASKGVMALYAPDSNVSISAVLSPEYYYIDDDRLALN